MHGERFRVPASTKQSDANEQRPQKERLLLRRHYNMLCVHAGGRHGSTTILRLLPKAGDPEQKPVNLHRVRKLVEDI